MTKGKPYRVFSGIESCATTKGKRFQNPAVNPHAYFRRPTGLLFKLQPEFGTVIGSKE